jgi:hypothetical protein
VYGAPRILLLVFTAGVRTWKMQFKWNFIAVHVQFLAMWHAIEVILLV